MKRLVHYLIIAAVLISTGVIIQIKAAVPNQYYANFDIKDHWDKTLGLFVQIDAQNKVGSSVIPASMFVDLLTHFQALFAPGKFPQDYAFQVVYQQCTLLTQQLSAGLVDDNYRSTLSSFMTNCYKPIQDVLKKINSEHTITTKGKASPSNGNAPLSVTFDARGSLDPSNETIPANNFYRYYRDTEGHDQVIGNAPVVNYTFEKEGNYQVHLTVKSSNKQKGILDGEQTIAIDVAPKAAILSIYANGQQMRKDKRVKIGTLEAQKGVVLDPSSTIAMGGRQFLSYHWEVSSKDGFAFTKDGDGKPDLIRLQLPGRGEYKVFLSVLDNENNTTSEKYDLIASDPVAFIKQNPDVGNTSTTFLFDGSASYSVLSAIKLYTWELYDQNGKKIETYQGKEIKYQFKKPGFYTTKLTIEDDLGQINTETQQIYVESTEPLAQFTATPYQEWLYPSRFILDASISSDVDKTNGFDDLSFEWIFPDEAKAQIAYTEEKNTRVIVDFNNLGKFTYKLIAKDSFGKQAEIAKDIEIKSILRPIIQTNPQATVWGSPVNFSVVTNEPILSYEWDFGDGDKRTLQTDAIAHTYRKTGIYKVKLRVHGENDMINEVNKTVFIGERNYPIAGYEVVNKNGMIMIQNEVCDVVDPDTNQKTKFPAYQIDRYQDFTINPAPSVNTKGEKTDLSYYFQPKGKEIYKVNDFRYKFDELGCTFVQLTTEDTTIGKNNQTRVWFKVVNALPKLDNIVLFFPQYGNEIGVGFNQNQIRDIFNNSYDPLIVKVTATNPVDSDGFVSYFKWYYYLKDDPTRVLETKITPSDIPYSFFSLPRIPGEYLFGVTMYDNDGGKTPSEGLIGNGPEVFFPPDSGKPDVPLVTLKVSQSAAEVGDELTFDVISKIISDRPDFAKERTISYDFDGDGERDLVTKKDHVTYSYSKPSETGGYRPRASVLYRGYRGVSNGGAIVIKNGLKPRILATTWGKLALFRDISLGDITEKTICPDMKACTDTSKISSGTAFLYEYPGYKKYFVSMNIRDQFANESKKVLALNITPLATGTNTAFHILSLPEASENKQNNTVDFFVGNALDNSVLFYFNHDDSLGACSADIDLTQDSNNDGNTNNDQDIPCNSLVMKRFQPTYESLAGRIYYAGRDGKMVSQDMTINFIDFQLTLDAETKKLYDQVGGFLKTLEGPQRSTGTLKRFRDLTLTLKTGLPSKTDTATNVVTLKEYMNTNAIPLTPEQRTQLTAIFTALSTTAIAAADGQGEYSIAKSEILQLLPENLQPEILALFSKFESTVANQSTQTSQQDERKTMLQNIIDAISTHIAPVGQAVGNNQIDKTDFDSVVLPNICKIMDIYNIPSSLCVNSAIKAVPDNVTLEQGTTTSSGGWLKWLFIILGIIVGIFIIAVVVFAIKAKMNQEEEEEETPPQAAPQA